MISRYKLNIILWYTGLLSGVLIAFFGILYSALSYQLSDEIEDNLREKIHDIDKILRDMPSPQRSERHFLDSIIAKRRYSFRDIREYTDLANEKYILFVFRSDRLMYLSDEHRHFKSFLKPFKVRENAIVTLTFRDVPFSVMALNRTGYSLYLGYELSTMKEVQYLILRIFAIIFPFGILLSVLCGYYVTQRSLRVIQTVNSTASRITAQNLSQRITLPKGQDEITRLIITLNSMIDRLVKSFNLAQQFSHDAAHEIRTPLTIVRGQIEELLNDDACDEQTSRTLESVLEELQYLSSITNRLLLLHNLDTGRIEYHFETLNLSSILEETFEDAQILAAEKKLSIELQKKDHICIQGNEELIFRLLWNIIDNAIKYTPEGGNVNIVLKGDKKKVTIRVHDTGIGIPAEETPKIFDRFYRVDKSRTRILGGSGLGLAICKWIVELHKGEIRVESEEGKGSEFTMVLPRSECEQETLSSP